MGVIVWWTQVPLPRKQKRGARGRLMKAWGEEEAWGIQWCRTRRGPCWRSWESRGQALWRFCG